MITSTSLKYSKSDAAKNTEVKKKGKMFPVWSPYIGHLSKHC